MMFLERIYKLAVPNDSRGFVCNYCRQTIDGNLQELPHTDDYLKIMRVLKGSMRWTINHVQHTLKAGDIVIMNNTELRKIDEILSLGEVVLDWIQFTPMTVYPNFTLSTHLGSVDFSRICAVFYRRPQGFSNVIDSRGFHYKAIDFYFERIAAEATAPSFLRDEVIVTNLRSLVIEISLSYEGVFAIEELLQNSPFDEEIEILTQAISYMRVHYADTISEAAMAERLSIRAAKLSRIFRNCTGMSFRTFLRQLRLEETLALLNRDPSLTVLDAALACGFNSASGFYKALNDICGKGGIRLLQQKQNDLLSP